MFSATGRRGTSRRGLTAILRASREVDPGNTARYDRALTVRVINWAMNSDHGVLQHTTLLEFGNSSDELARRLEQELHAFEEAAHDAGQSWSELLVGRDWTFAQECEHVVLVNEASAKIARLLLSDKPLRPAPPMAGEVIDGRRQAPAGSLPGPGLPWSELGPRHEASRHSLLSAVRGGPERSERTFPHPFLGPLSALDWVRMACAHTRHHRRQIESSLLSRREA